MVLKRRGGFKRTLVSSSNCLPSLAVKGDVYCIEGIGYTIRSGGGGEAKIEMNVNFKI